MKYIPNAITALRLVLLLPFIATLLSERYIAALIVYLTLEALDQLDGKIACLIGAKTKAGIFWDAFVDSLTHMTAFIFLFAVGLFHILILLVIIWREFCIMFLRLVSLLTDKPIGSLMIGKLKALIHALTIAYALWVLSLGRSGASLLQAMIYASAGVSIVSGLWYIYRGRSALQKVFI